MGIGNKEKRSQRFLETITLLGNDVLVPIKDIQYVIYKINIEGNYEIHIKGKEENLWIECFDSNKKKADARYKMIKRILGSI